MLRVGEATEDQVVLAFRRDLLIRNADAAIGGERHVAVAGCAGLEELRDRPGFAFVVTHSEGEVIAREGCGLAKAMRFCPMRSMPAMQLDSKRSGCSAGMVQFEMPSGLKAMARR